MAKTRTTRKTVQKPPSRKIEDKAQYEKPPSRKIEDKAQYERFREFAREIETDDNPEAFDRAFRKIVPPKTDKER